MIKGRSIERYGRRIEDQRLPKGKEAKKEDLRTVGTDGRGFWRTEKHEAIQFARKRQKSERFASLYSNRAGIEGTFSQGVRAFGLRQARYRGLKRTHLQEVATATAVNVGRITNWLNAVPTAATGRSRLAALA